MVLILMRVRHAANMISAGTGSGIGSGIGEVTLLQFRTSWGARKSELRSTRLGMAIILAFVGLSLLVGPAWAADNSDASASTVSAEADDGKVQQEAGSGRLEPCSNPLPTNGAHPLEGEQACPWQ